MSYDGRNSLLIFIFCCSITALVLALMNSAAIADMKSVDVIAQKLDTSTLITTTNFPSATGSILVNYDGGESGLVSMEQGTMRVAGIQTQLPPGEGALETG